MQAVAKNVQIKMLGGFHIFADDEVCDGKIGKTRKGQHAFAISDSAARQERA